MEKTQNLDCNKIELAFDEPARKLLDELKAFFKYPDDATLIANSVRLMDWYKQQLESNTQIITRDANNKVSAHTFKF